MRISNGKVSYSSVSPSGEKSKPVFPNKTQIPKKLVAYDDDDDSSSLESDKDAKKSPSQTKPTLNGSTNGSMNLKSEVNGEVKKETVIKSSFQPILDSRLSTTVQVPGSYGPLDKSNDAPSTPIKKQDQLRVIVNGERLSILPPGSAATTPEPVNATSQKWQIAEQGARSPSVASSNGSINSAVTARTWQIMENTNGAHSHRANSQERGGWTVSPPPVARRILSSPPALGSSFPQPAFPSSHMNGNKNSAEGVKPLDKGSEKMLNGSNSSSFSSPSQQHINNNHHHHTNGHNTPTTNGHTQDHHNQHNEGEDSDRKKKKKKKKKRKREEGEIVEEEEPPVKKSKKKKKKSKDRDEMMSPPLSGSSETSRASSVSDSSSKSQPQEEDDDELEDGEWVERTIETIEEEKKQKMPTTNQGENLLSFCKNCL